MYYIHINKKGDENEKNRFSFWEKFSCNSYFILPDFISFKLYLKFFTEINFCCPQNFFFLITIKSFFI